MDGTERITDSRRLADEAVKVLDANKAKDIRLLKVENHTVITDYFVICTGNSSTQIKSLAGELEFRLTELGNPPAQIDGYETGSWAALDFGTVIVHIFKEDQREFYKLEKLWSDAEEIPVVTTED